MIPVLLAAPPQPDSPNGNLLGWLIVFFMIVWPVLRGVMAAAQERRKEHVERERRRIGGAPPPPVKKREPFERLRRALEEQARQARELAEGRTPQAGGAPPARRVIVPRPAGSDVPEVVIERDPAAWLDEGEDARDDRSLTGDPFDERSMERDLVPASDPGRFEALHEEVQGDPEGLVLPSARTALGRLEGAQGARAAVGASAAQGARGARGTRIHSGTFAVRRIDSRVTSPWGRAVVYQELLGDPVAFREPRW